MTHATKYPGPILSVAISPNAALLAVGLANGQLLVRKHSHNKGAVPGLPGVHGPPIRQHHSTAMVLLHQLRQSISFFVTFVLWPHQYASELRIVRCSEVSKRSWRHWLCHLQEGEAE